MIVHFNVITTLLSIVLENDSNGEDGGILLLILGILFAGFLTVLFMKASGGGKRKTSTGPSNMSDLINIAENNPRKLANHLNSIQSFSNHENSVVRANSASLLARLAAVNKDDARTLLPECASLLNDSFDDARRNALVAMQEIAEKHPESVAEYREEVINILHRDTNTNTQREAADLLAIIGDNESIDALNEAASNVNDPELRGELYDLIDKAEDKDQSVSPNITNSGGPITACPQCGNHFEDMSHVPRHCQACGANVIEELS